MLSPTENFDIGRICWNDLCATIDIKQIATFEMMQIGLAIATIANETSWRVVRKGLEFGAELSAFTLNFHRHNFSSMPQLRYELFTTCLIHIRPMRR